MKGRAQRAQNPPEHIRLNFPKGPYIDREDSIYILHKWDSASDRFVRFGRDELQEASEVDIGSPSECKQNTHHQFPEIDRLRNAKIKRRTKALKKAVQENRRLTEHLSRQLTLLTTQPEEANSHLPLLGKIDRAADRFADDLNYMSFKMDTLDDEMDALDDRWTYLARA
ncbi:hypothetical protein QBC40DRAFT_332816 [Triangularia verruculosa]|uniref:Uncharacterized protein n=1 Tax=Triangularia verruculosa TaxID=2587418 RepID=A0AAN7ASM8_9PEZI|nr:hypothetical protein QBC40DRAFT_332816 [Triangularia verruculosa]